ncbi:hypothetical protein MK489_14290 [Myxococcota bacterium]|nr:hypothetical protein [Myxococcota bacterium]
MEGRKHDAVIVESLTNSQGTQASEWEAERKNSQESNGTSRGTAFRLAEGYELGDASHVVIHETSTGEASAQAQSIEAGEGNTVASYTKIAEFGPIASGPTAGVVLVFTDCDDPAEEDTFNEWYSGHLHHTVESIDFYAATRYVSDDPTRTPSKYLAIYETESSNPSKVQQDGVDWWVKGGFEGPAGMVLLNEVACERVD